jgi:chaperone required for assembly of F1-ATPase
VIPVAQSKAAIQSLREAVSTTSDFELTALSCAVEASGSLLIGLAVLHGRLDGDAAFASATVEEHYQAQRWGIDPEAERRRQDIAADLRAAVLFLSLTRCTFPNSPAERQERQARDERSR